MAAVFVLAAAVLPYLNTLNAPFIFDDLASVVNNESIRELDSSRVLAPGDMKGAGVHGRPLVNLSLALNYAISGLSPWSYHLTNSLLHAASALLLLGLLRRVLPRVFPSSAPSSTLALGIALLWAAHPLLTETVTCIIQRTEGLVGFFILLSLYSFVRAQDDADSEGATCGRLYRSLWLAGSVAACATGMFAKELMAVLPVFILLLDRQLYSADFRSTLRGRCFYYLGLAGTYACLLVSMSLAPERGGSVGFGLGMSAWHYALTQCEALSRYLGLCLWPAPLVLDYGSYLVTDLSSVLLQGIVILGLLAGTVHALVKRLPVGLLGAWFFGILAPSSSFIPLTTQTIAEHRMYLPSIAVILLVVLLLKRFLAQATFWLCLALSLILGVLTFSRNEDYRSGISIWNDTVAKRPENPRAHFNLGNACLAEGRASDAVRHFRRALDLCQGKERHRVLLAYSAYNLGCAQLSLKENEAAVDSLRQFLAFKPNGRDGWINLAEALHRLERLEEASEALDKALVLKPRDAAQQLKLADLYTDRGMAEKAIEHYRASLGIDPNQAAAQAGLGGALLAASRVEEALGHLEAAGRLEPNNPSIETNAAIALVMLKRPSEARARLEKVLRLKPDYAPAKELLDQLQR